MPQSLGCFILARHAENIGREFFCRVVGEFNIGYLLLLRKEGFSYVPPVASPLALSTAEQAIIKRIRQAKLFVCLRQHRHERFGDNFQQELAALYTDRPQGQPPVPPAQLALATMESSPLWSP
jgi:hypothetical protein